MMTRNRPVIMTLFVKSASMTAIVGLRGSGVRAGGFGGRSMGSVAG